MLAASAWYNVATRDGNWLRMVVAISRNGKCVNTYCVRQSLVNSRPRSPPMGLGIGISSSNHCITMRYMGEKRACKLFLALIIGSKDESLRKSHAAREPLSVAGAPLSCHASLP